MISNDFAMFQPTGAAAHLLLSIKPLTAILFYEWLKNKKDFSALGLVFLALGTTASSFIKYHIISLVLIIFVYCCVNETKYFVKYGIWVISAMFHFFYWKLSGQLSYEKCEGKF